jgi:hypothetical protein
MRYLLILFLGASVLAQPFSVDDYAFVGAANQRAGAAPLTFGNGYATTDGAEASTITVADVASGSGANRLIVAVFAWNNPGSLVTCSAATWNGIAMTRFGGTTPEESARMVDVWYLVAPTADTSGSVVATLSEPRYYRSGVVMTFSGANQTTPLSGLQAVTSGGSASGTVNVTSAVGAIVMDCLAVYGADVTFAEGAGQTLRASHGTNPNVKTFATTEAGAPTTTMSWTLSGAAMNAYTAFSVNPQ